MEIKEHRCFNCGSFEAYFTKAYCCYLREDCGMCKKQNKVINKQSTCEKWHTRFYDRKKRKSAVRGVVLTDISVIRQFIEED